MLWHVRDCANSESNIHIDCGFGMLKPVAPLQKKGACVAKCNPAQSLPVGPRSESTYSDESVAESICLFRFCNDRAKTHPCRQSLSEPFTISCYLQVLVRYTAVDI